MKKKSFDKEKFKRVTLKILHVVGYICIGIVTLIAILLMIPINKENNTTALNSVSGNNIVKRAPTDWYSYGLDDQYSTMSFVTNPVSGDTIDRVYKFDFYDLSQAAHDYEAYMPDRFTGTGAFAFFHSIFFTYRPNVYFNPQAFGVLFCRNYDFGKLHFEYYDGVDTYVFNVGVLLINRTSDSTHGEGVKFNSATSSAGNNYVTIYEDKYVVCHNNVGNVDKAGWFANDVTLGTYTLGEWNKEIGSGGTNVQMNRSVQYCLSRAMDEWFNWDTDFRGMYMSRYGLNYAYRNGLEGTWDDAYTIGQQDGYNTGYEAGYSAGEVAGEQIGYNNGLEAANTHQGEVNTMLGVAFTGLGSILSMEVLPNITLGVLLFIPLVVVVIISVLRILKK